MHKINTKLLTKDKGFSWSIRYSETDETDDIGRWSRICYYNGLYIAWVNGYVYTETYPNIDNRRTGKVNRFWVSLRFPITSQQHSGHDKFHSFEEAKTYVEEIFKDFKKHINK